MLSFLLTNCTDCDNLEDAICSVDAALAQYGKDAWFNQTYMTDKPVQKVMVKRLIMYRDILHSLKWDQLSYCPPYSMPHIISRAKALSGAISPIVRRLKLPVYPTTTTTTTTSTSTTTTTSTSTTTTSSTTHSTTSTTTTTTTT